MEFVKQKAKELINKTSWKSSYCAHRKDVISLVGDEGQSRRKSWSRSSPSLPPLLLSTMSGLAQPSLRQCHPESAPGFFLSHRWYHNARPHHHIRKQVHCDVKSPGNNAETNDKMINTIRNIDYVPKLWSYKSKHASCYIKRANKRTQLNALTNERTGYDEALLIVTIITVTSFYNLNYHRFLEKDAGEVQVSSLDSVHLYCTTLCQKRHLLTLNKMF